MNKQKATTLLKRYENGDLSDEERLRLNQWYLLETVSSEETLSDEQRKQSYAFLKANLPVVAIRKTAWLWPRVAAVAAVLALMVLGVLFFRRLHQSGSISGSQYTQDIAPGKKGATLTLANGKKIKLSDAENGEIAHESGISVTKTADGQLVYQIKETVDNADKMNTLSTAKGETYILSLPDKSKVWLNAASSLTYSANLMNRGVRRVKLEGEAYFEIFKDKTHPFVVETSKQQVEVLGTHFNINSYADETATTTTLLEGSVKVTTGNLKRILEPGQQALNRDGSIDVTTADVENVIDWKNGDFFLDRVDFRTAMRKIARWYDVEVIYDASVPTDLKSSGYISRTRKLSSVLKLIGKSGQVHFRIEGSKIYVSK